MSPKKLIVLTIAGVLGLGAMITIALLGNPGDPPPADEDTQDQAPESFSIWILEDETAGYSDIITGFRDRYPEYADTEFELTKFPDWEGYRRLLLLAITDGNSPDVFMVPNNGDDLFASKTFAIPPEAVSVDDFSKNFERVFDELVLTETLTDEEGNAVESYALKGIPMGYETLALYYNFRQVRVVPETWSEFSEDIAENDSPDYAPVGLGLGPDYVPLTPDIIQLLLLQNGINTYENMGESVGLAALSGYRSFAEEEKNPVRSMREKMDALYLDVIDLFARGEIGMVVGYPSTLEQIREAIKRADSEAELSERFLRTATIPQLSTDPETPGRNLVSYRYFVASRFSDTPDMAFDFLSYLAWQEAQRAYMEAFAYTLPALRALETERREDAITDDIPRVRYEHFLDSTVERASFDTGLPESFDTGMRFLFERDDTDLGERARKTAEYISCEYSRFVEGENPQSPCILVP